MQRHLITTTTTSTFVKIAAFTAAGLAAAVALAAILFFAPTGTDPSSAPGSSAAATADQAAAVQAAAAEAELAAAGAEAEATIGSAQGVLVSAATKVDTTALEASVTQLADYKVLSLDRVLELTDHTRSATQQTADAVAAADAAQMAADEAAAAEAAAAEVAAAEAAAAQAARANTPDGARALGAELAASLHGWGADQFMCLDKLWTKESHWTVDADNPSSSAYGIPQALPGNKMASAGGDWATSARTQIVWGLDYIKSSYGTPCSAWSHSVAVDWY